MVEDMQRQNAQTERVRGPNGQWLTLDDLPPKNIKRWVTRRKAEVVAAVQGGLISRDDALDRYDLSVEEYEGWERLYTDYGTKGLRATCLQEYR